MSVEFASRRRRNVFRALVAVISLCIALAAVEIALRVRDPFGFRVHGSRLTLPANTQWVWPCGLAPFDPVIVHTKNSLGFRGPEPPSDFARRLTVVCVGGSTTECRMLSDGTDWPAIMATRLAPRFSGLWVNNAGLDGHSTFGHILLVQDCLSRLHPKVAVFLVGRNELWNDRPNQFDCATEAGRRRLSAGGTIMIWLAERSRVASMILNLARYREAVRRGQAYFGLRTEKGSIALSYARGMVRAWSDGPRLPADLARTEALLAQHRQFFIEPYRERLAALVRQARAAHIEPVLVTQPVLPGFDPLDAPEQAGALASAEVVRGVDGRSFRALMDLYNRTLIEYAQAASVPVIDLAASLPRRAAYFYDDSHFTRAGAEAVGNIVAAGLAPILEKIPKR
jgi:hypothetical protein